MKVMKKIFSMLLVICVTITMFAQIGAVNEKANAEIVSLYDNHIYVDTNSTKVMGLPKMYGVERVVSTFESPNGQILKTPDDMFIYNDHIFISDTVNNRIVKLDRTGNFLMEVSTLTCKEHNSPTGCSCTSVTKLNKPSGIYIDSDEDIYIADTSNKRVVHVDAEGYFVEEFTKPKNEPSLENCNFDVTKVYISNKGVIYLLFQTLFEGFVMLDTKGRYLGNSGMTFVTTSLTDFIWSRLSGQSNFLERASMYAPPYSNFVMDHTGSWIYATIATAESDQIMKINSAGENVYPKGVYGLNRTEANESYTSFSTYKSAFVDIAVDKDGIIYALDGSLGKIFIYDHDGNNLAYFGALGTNRGYFKNPVSIGLFSDGSVVVLDKGTGYITIFNKTKFCDLVFEGTLLYHDALYPEAREVWTELLEMNANYVYAHKAIAKAYLKEKNYVAAMESYKEAQYKLGYSEAFEAQKKIITKDYFFLIVFIVIILLIALIYGYRVTKKYVDKLHMKITTWGGNDN